ncbi:hypothetical protein Spock_118 [Bacillus phage Spock]|uniref:Uncharacterized protein n=1 Tax=Bacillus phage Spock TaxID=1406791 RepID=U5Q0W6_9CAUD|nr:hypothetical protein Spock_118 [Bacillus phage Spock]AGY48518.1 hypothetical protein Spock_118 [Bacillus phage Spock]
MATKTKKELQEEIENLQTLVYRIMTQGALPIEDMQVYMEYLLTGQVKSEEHAEQINELAQRSATISDATILARLSFTQIMQEIDEKLTHVMREVQLQKSVLEKLGATAEMYDEAAESHDKKVKEMMEAHTTKKEEVDETTL